MPKINFIIHFFLEILHFKESCNLIGWQHFWPIWIGGEISTTIIVSILDYFQEKLLTKCFKESQKPYSGAFLGPCDPNLGKNEFSWKKGLCQFLNIPIIYRRDKNQKKLMSHCWEKHRTDGWTDRRTDGRTDNVDSTGPSEGRGSNNSLLVTKQSGLMPMTGTCSEISFSATTNRSSGSLLYSYFQPIDNKVLLNRKIYFPKKYHWYGLL